MKYWVTALENTFDGSVVDWQKIGEICGWVTSYILALDLCPLAKNCILFMHFLTCWRKGSGIE